MSGIGSRESGGAHREAGVGRGLRAALPLAFVLMVVSPALAQQLVGRVSWQTRDAAPPAQAVVYAEPLDRPAPGRSGEVTISQKNKTFLPHVAAVTAGSTVVFPNDDQIFHNVFSLSPPRPFDMGLYRAGVSKRQTFERPGVYHIFCNIHPQMAAFLVVAPTPYVTVTDQDGAFRLDTPAGRYRVTALSERSAAVSVEVTLEGAQATVEGLVLDESAFVSTKHLNKFGKPYPREAYKPN